MKTIDVRHGVMKNVADFERSRIHAWAVRFLVVSGVLAASFISVFILIIRRLLEQRTLDIFELFVQDPEIIREFWSDVLEIFLDELPAHLLFISAGIAVILAGMFLLTARKRLIMKKKLSQLDKYV